MSTIQHLPTWARTQAEDFRSHGKLSGAGVQQQQVPAEAVQQMESQLFSQIDQLISLDGTPLDLAPEVPGKVGFKEGGMDVTTHFEGDTKVGNFALESQGEMVTAAFGECSAEKAILIQTMEFSPGQYGTIAAFIDRAEPAKSYVQMKDIPPGMGLF